MDSKNLTELKNFREFLNKLISEMEEMRGGSLLGDLFGNKAAEAASKSSAPEPSTPSSPGGLFSASDSLAPAPSAPSSPGGLFSASDSLAPAPSAPSSPGGLFSASDSPSPAPSVPSLLSPEKPFRGERAPLGSIRQGLGEVLPPSNSLFGGITKKRRGKKRGTKRKY